MGRRLGRKMLATAEADLQPEAAVAGKISLEVDLPVVGDGEAQLRQSLGEQALAPGTQPVSGAPAIEQALDCPALLAVILAQNAPRRASTRSVRSQEKPPSGSGARPKCP